MAKPIEPLAPALRIPPGAEGEPSKILDYLMDRVRMTSNEVSRRMRLSYPDRFGTLTPVTVRGYRCGANPMGDVQKAALASVLVHDFPVALFHLPVEWADAWCRVVHPELFDPVEVLDPSEIPHLVVA